MLVDVALPSFLPSHAAVCLSRQLKTSGSPSNRLHASLESLSLGPSTLQLPKAPPVSMTLKHWRSWSTSNLTTRTAQPSTYGWEAFFWPSTLLSWWYCKFGSTVTAPWLKPPRRCWQGQKNVVRSSFGTCMDWMHSIASTARASLVFKTAMSTSPTSCHHHTECQAILMPYWPWPWLHAVSYKRFVAPGRNKKESGSMKYSHFIKNCITDATVPVHRTFIGREKRTASLGR